MNSRRTWNWLIILGTLGLVLGPVVASQYRAEVARWHLAIAANAVVMAEASPSADPSDRLEARHLAQAAKWVDDISELRDYWLYRIMKSIELHQQIASGTLPMKTANLPDNQLSSHGSEQEAAAGVDNQILPVSKIVAEAIKKDQANFTLGLNYASEELFRRRQFAEAVAVLEVSCIDNLRDNFYFLNQLAYFRALAGIELDQALVDINRALAQVPEEGSWQGALRDTRAWILFQMGKPLEALPDADFAVKQVEQEPDLGLMGDTLQWLEQTLTGRPKPRSADKILTRKEAGAALWGKATLYYHRARILQALGRTEQAESDYDWLRRHQLPTDERLF